MKIKSLLDEDNPTLDTISNILLGLPLLAFFSPTLGKYLLIFVIALIVLGLIFGKLVSEKIFRIALFGFVFYLFIFIAMFSVWKLLMRP